MFSSRLPASLTPTPIAVAMAAHRQDRRIRADLTRANPTTAGFSYPETLASAWSNEASLDYTPDARGLASARETVAACRDAGTHGDPDRIVLTASTSEAYGFLFKVLCNPGDRVLAPAPSYPLLDHLAALEAVILDRYALHDAGRWTIDLAHLQQQVTRDTRAIVVVAPNNPTGSVPSADEWAALLSLCARSGVALIVDEVFAPYGLDADTAGVAAAALVDPPALVFRLNGLSKLIGLPQAKLAWIVTDGPDDLVREAMTRLEIVADTYLSVSTAVQLALPTLLDAGGTVRAQIQARLERNLQALDGLVRWRDALSLRRPQGGWTAVLRLAPPDDPDELTSTLLAHGVLTHPAYFYDFAHDGYLVVSLLGAPDEFDCGVHAIASLSVPGDRP